MTSSDIDNDTNLQMENGMLNQLCFRPVWEPQEVDIVGESRVFSAHVLEFVRVGTGHQNHSEIVAHSSGIMITKEYKF